MPAVFQKNVPAISATIHARVILSKIAERQIDPSQCVFVVTDTIRHGVLVKLPMGNLENQANYQFECEIPGLSINSS